MRVPTIVGVDPSSNKLSAVITQGDLNPELHRIKLPRDKVRACRVAYEWVITLVEPFPLPGVYVFLEMPVLGRGGAGSTIPQAQVNGAMLAAGSMAGVQVVTVNNKRWKKQVVGNGAASKEDVAAWCALCWPPVFEGAKGDQDLLDAAAINRFGRHVVELRDRIGERIARRVAARRTA